MTEAKKSLIQKISLSILVTIIFSGFLYTSIKPILKDINIWPTKEYSGYQVVMQLKAEDPEGGQVKYKIINIFPEHDFIVDSIKGIIYINTANIKSNQYKIHIGYYDDAGNGTYRSYIINDVKYIK